MSYTPTEWGSTDVVTATRMNALEQAVGEMNMSYTPNVWSDGDILSAEKMNALEQAVASGGGGSSDFSTAQVTVTVTGGYLHIPTVISTPIDAILDRQVNAMSGEVSLIVPLYKGSLALSAKDGASVNVTGDIQDMGRGGILITGDGTITIS